VGLKEPQLPLQQLLERKASLELRVPSRKARPPQLLLVLKVPKEAGLEFLVKQLTTDLFLENYNFVNRSLNLLLSGLIFINIFPKSLNFKLSIRFFFL
jgi:hypothetical protein